jgi:predicted transcriptional regulator
MRKSQGKHPTSIRLTEEAKQLLQRLAEDLGVTQSAVLEIAIREYARGRIGEASKRTEEQRG